MAIIFEMEMVVGIITSLMVLVIFLLILDMKSDIKKMDSKVKEGIKNMNLELQRTMKLMAADISIATSLTSNVKRSIWDFMISRENIMGAETNTPSLVQVEGKDRSGEIRISLPVVVVANILSRLPGKNLSRLRSVCMQWNTLLSYNHHFMLEHHRKALHLRPMLISGYSNVNGTVPLFSIREMKDCSVNNIASHSYYKVSNPVNGLVYLCHEYNGDNYLANPSTLEIASFPKSNFHWDCSNCSIGLGYDEDEKVYKIVKLTIKNDETVCLCEVITTVTASWPFLEEISVVVLCDTPCCFLDGKLHWLTLRDKHPLSLGILSFDVKQEKFETFHISVEFDSNTKSSHMALKEFRHHFYLVRGSEKSVQMFELTKCNDNNIFSFKGEQVFHIDMSVHVSYSLSRFQVAYADVLSDNFLIHNKYCLYHFHGRKLRRVRKVCSILKLDEKSWLHVFAESLLSPRKLFISDF